MAFSKIAFIVNPHAGNGSTESNWSYIEAVARDRLGHFETYMTQKPGDAVRFAEDAVAKDAGLLVCVGGDGTLNEVINGIMMHEESKRSSVILGFVPNGTGCDFVKTLPIPQNIEHAIDAIAGGYVRAIDLGRLSHLFLLCGRRSYPFFYTARNGYELESIMVLNRSLRSGTWPLQMASTMAAVCG
ncbi:MAG: acylglycerol kinase family protein [Deltaproteobacteria bacterium]|nr:acylglycerol kinase family protein [Deltaproteobacteria bacterium]